MATKPDLRTWLISNGFEPAELNLSEEEVEDGLATALEDDSIEVVGEEDGEPFYRLTAKGIAYVERLITRKRKEAGLE